MTRTGERSGCAVLFMTIVGLLLMLPGLCSLVFMGYMGLGKGLESIWLITFLLAGFGLCMILIAIARGNRSP
jgi:hypothetical protein